MGTKGGGQDDWKRLLRPIFVADDHRIEHRVHIFYSRNMTLTVHHLNNSRSQRILWLLEELEVPYEIERYQRQPNHRAPESLRKIHPLGKSPVITDGDITLAESGAIVEYIIDKYGNGRAQPSQENKVANTMWSHYAEGRYRSVAHLLTSAADSRC